MKRYPKPDYEKFLVQVVYGPCKEDEYLEACVSAPYLDFCRTMHGFGQMKNKDKIHENAFAKVLSEFKKLAVQSPKTQRSFDLWHRELSTALIGLFHRGRFRFYDGQSQKWINIAFKNIFACGEKRVPGFQPVYDFCHMPIDNIVLDQLSEKGIPKPDKPWSMWNYEEYFQFQVQLREWCGGQPLLNIEHQLWIDGRNT